MTPEAEAVLKRARRSFGISILLLLVGLMAVMGALVYRATRDPAPAVQGPVAGSLQLPQGADIVSAIVADGAVTVTYRLGPATQIRVFDSVTGAVTGQIDLKIGE